MSLCTKKKTTSSFQPWLPTLRRPNLKSNATNSFLLRWPLRRHPTRLLHRHPTTRFYACTVLLHGQLVTCSFFLSSCWIWRFCSASQFRLHSCLTVNWNLRLNNFACGLVYLVSCWFWEQMQNMFQSVLVQCLKLELVQNTIGYDFVCINFVSSLYWIRINFIWWLYWFC